MKFKSTTPSHHLGSNIQNVISLLKMHHPKICGNIHGGANRSPSCNDTNTIRHHATRRTPSTPNTTRKRDYNINNHDSNHKTQNQFRIVRSRSVPYCPNRVGSKAALSRRNQCQYNMNKQVHQEFNRQSCQKTNRNEIESNFTNSIDNLEWNELLRILQAEYTKLVL